MAKTRGLNWEKNTRNRRKDQDASEHYRQAEQTSAELTAIKMRLRRKQDMELVDDILALLDPEQDQEHVIAWYQSSRQYLQDNPNRSLRQDFHESAMKTREQLRKRKAMQLAGTWTPDPTKRSPKGYPGRPKMSKDAVRSAVRRTTWKEAQAKVKELSPWLADPALLPKKPPNRKPRE